MSTCDCHSNWDRMNTGIISCNATTGLIEKEGNSWLAYNNESRSYMVMVGCTSKYCNPDLISFTLENPDLQCASNRTSVVCGGCAEGLSLLLGTDNCGVCSN